MSLEGYNHLLIPEQHPKKKKMTLKYLRHESDLHGVTACKINV